MISGRKTAAKVIQGPTERHQHREEHTLEDLRDYALDK